MVEQDSLEFEVLRSQFDYLVSCISIGSILPKARTTLITVPDYNDCKAERTDDRKAQRLLECLEKEVTSDPGKFHEFVAILDSIGQKAVAQRLRDTLAQCKRARQNPSMSARVYLPEQLEIVHKLTFLKTAFSKLLTDFRRSVQQALDNCSKEQNEDFISTLQNDLERHDFNDFQSGYRLLTSDVSLFNVQHLRCIVMLLPEKYRDAPDQLLTDYETELQDFMKSTTVNEYKKYCEENLLELIASSVVPVSMKLFDKWRRRTLEDLKQLTCRLLKVPGSRLHLHVITEHCVAVHWLCPLSVLPALREAITACNDALYLEGINQIFIGQESVIKVHQSQAISSSQLVISAALSRDIAIAREVVKELMNQADRIDTRIGLLHATRFSVVGLAIGGCVGIILFGIASYFFHFQISGIDSLRYGSTVGGVLGYVIGMSSVVIRDSDETQSMYIR